MALQHLPKPFDLVGGLEKGVSSIDLGVLPLNEVFEFADRLGSYVSHALVLSDIEESLFLTPKKGSGERPDLSQEECVVVVQ